MLGERGLRMAAYQRVRGIAGLEDREIARRHGIDVSAGRYIASIAQVASKLDCTPGYLSKAALRRGYSYSRALRWIRFCHGVALREVRVPADLAALRTGFSDPSGWTRFVRALLGRGPSQLPNVPLGCWAGWAVEDVYLGRTPFGGSGCGESEE